MFNFAEDLAEESLADALENGNLRGEKSRAQREIENPGWNDRNAWVSQGYYISLHRTGCKCGNVVDFLCGVFHEEKSPSGKIRCIRFDGDFQIPKSAIQPTRISHFSTRICLACVSGHGFSLPTDPKEPA
jgi:hypothetical protein